MEAPLCLGRLRSDVHLLLLLVIYVLFKPFSTDETVFTVFIIPAPESANTP